jgi:hypothetical protein
LNFRTDQSVHGDCSSRTYNLRFQVWNPTNRLFLPFKILRVDRLGGETFTPIDYNDGGTTKEYHHICLGTIIWMVGRLITSEPLAAIAADDAHPVTCAIDVKDKQRPAPRATRMETVQVPVRQQSSKVQTTSTSHV